MRNNRTGYAGLEATFRGNNLTGTLPAALSYKLFVVRYNPLTKTAAGRSVACIIPSRLQSSMQSKHGVGQHGML